uniref:PRELI/MSF1 domain-containing protein n=1 Tax=Araucaria cunninghamii TaxID=56994 RepID=A0A0D6R7B0_ARACU
MVKGYTQEYVYKHPWERVTAASWRKFTDLENKPLLSHVMEVDTVIRTVDKSSGRLYSTRAIAVNTPGPRWLDRLIGHNVCYCIESSVVDANRRSMEMVTRNVTLKDFVEVEEKCWYLPHHENPQWTLFKQETNIRCPPLSALASMAEKVEQRCADKFLQNSLRGREVMENICRHLEAESNGINI